MDIIFILISLSLGFVVGFLLQKSRNAKLEAEFPVAKLAGDNAKAAIEMQNNQINTLNHSLNSIENQLNNRTQEYRELLGKFNQSSEKLSEIEGLKNNAEKEVAALKSELKSLENTITVEREKLKEQFEKFKQVEDNFKNEFKNLAQEILDEKAKKFSESGKKDIDELIKPLKEKLGEFSNQVQNTYEKSSKEQVSLKEELKRLTELNTRLSDEAKNLANALKGDNKTQGDWGEMILENILTNSGLTKGREYVMQESSTNESGERLRLDVKVNYPDNRFIIIDSKVSLTAYEKYFADAENPKLQELHLAKHIESINGHVKILSSKNYQDNYAGSPDFVMMFMPIEAAYLLAIQHDPGLWQRAYDKRVLIISPTNLIAALKMINELWKHDYQNKNAQKIADEAANLYDKFVGFYRDLDEIAKAMEKVQRGFDEAKSKLSDGKGNLVRRVEMLRKLGVKPKTTMPESATKNQQQFNLEEYEE